MSKPTLAVIEGETIVIRVPFKDIPTLLSAAEDLASLPASQRVKIRDVNEYAQDVARALNKEEPNDGTSLIDTMLDQALFEAIDQGSEGIDYP